MSGPPKSGVSSVNRIVAEASSAAMPALSPEDAALDAQWRVAFGQPLPLLGAGPLVRAILADKAADAGQRPVSGDPPTGGR